MSLQLAVENLSLMKGTKAKLHIASASEKYSRVIRSIVEGDNYLKVSILLLRLCLFFIIPKYNIPFEFRESARTRNASNTDKR